MNSRIELAVLGASTTTGNTITNGFIDLYEDEPISIKMSLSDIKDISSRSGSFSQSFTVPGTKNNNQLFGQIFNIGNNSKFDTRKKTPCYLSVDSIPVLNNGVLQLTKIVVDENHKIDYEISIFSETQDLFDNIGDKYLSDLDFSDLNHTKNYANITGTWTGSTDKYFYPMLDYGYEWDMNGLQTSGATSNQFFPALQVKTIVDRIFTAANKTYNSNFFNSTYFKNLYIPFNNNVDTLADTTFCWDREFHATRTTQDLFVGNTTVVPSGVTYTVPGQYSNLYTTAFNNDSTNGNFDNSNLFSTTTATTYTANTTCQQTFYVQLDYGVETTVVPGSYLNLVSPGVQVFAQFFYTPLGGSPVQYMPGVFPALQFSGRTQATVQSPTIILNSGDTFTVKFTVKYAYYSNSSSNYINVRVYSGSNIYNKVDAVALPNQFQYMNSFVPQKIKQKDFLNSLIDMHNLYLAPNKDNINTVIVEPRDNYYSASTVSKDWSKKLDLKIAINESVISEASNKEIYLTHKADKDYFNDNYFTQTNKIYGEYIYKLDSDFIEGQKKIETIFSPTPSVAIHYSQTNPYVANEFLIPKFLKVDTNGNYGSTDFNIRILQRNPNRTIVVQSGDWWYLDGHPQTTFPYAGMLNHPSTGDTDICFGTVDYVYYGVTGITNNNLVNTYWKNYLDQINDKDSKIITANFYLTPADIESFKFSDSIYVEGISEDGAGHYFIVNNIDYSPTSNGSSKVELIKVSPKYTQLNQFSIIKNNTTEGQKQFFSLNLGNNQVLATGSVAVGNNNIIASNARNSTIFGDNNNVLGGSINALINGDNNIIDTATIGAIVYGNNNFVTSGATNATVYGSYLTADTNNTLYTSNLNIPTGGLVNGIPVTAITTVSQLMTIGTGAYSSRMVNQTSMVASGDYSYAEGSGTTAAGNASHAEGFFSVANGFASHSEGISTTAQGDYASHSEGNATQAIGQSSHAENYLSIANGDYSHAEGQNTTTSGQSSHSEGLNTTAGGINSHAGGENNISNGTDSFAHGYYNSTLKDFSTVFGMYGSTHNTNEFAIGGGYTPGSQTGVIQFNGQTGNAVGTELFLNGVLNDRFYLYSTAYYCEFTFVAAHSTSAACAGCKLTALVKNVLGTITIIGATITGQYADAALAGVVFAINSDNTYQSIYPKVTGIAGNSINYNVKMSYTRVS